MAGSEILLAGQASVWAQPNGPNTKPLYLGCHQVGDVEVPEGDLTRLFCPDPAATGKYKVAGSFQGEPGLPTFSIDTPIGKTRDYLESWNCQGNVIVNKVSSGRRDLFTNYDRSFAFLRAVRTGRTLSALASRQPADEAESMQSLPFSFEQLVECFDLTSTRQTILATSNLLAVWFQREARCAGNNWSALSAGQVGVVVGAAPDASVPAEAPLFLTYDGGGTWVASSTSPFAAAEDISAVVAFDIGPTARRILVARGTTDAANPAEVAYCDDEDGTTWTLVELGDTDGLYVTGPSGLFVLDPYNIWAVTSAGHIFYSEDGGVSWKEQESGVLTAGNLNCVGFADDRVGYAAGANNAILKTEDGGVSWGLVTGPAGKAAVDIQAMAVVTRNRVFLGYADGDLWYTEDGGASWAERSFPGSGAGEISSIRFLHEMVGMMAYNDAAGTGSVLRTRDGGYTWEPESLPTNDGINDIYVVDENLAFIAGDLSGASPFLGKVFEA